MNLPVLAVFIAVYAGMVLGRLPGLALDRTGVALLGAIALLALREIEPDAAWRAIDVPTIALLFGMMVVSAQLRLAGFYARVTHWIAALDARPTTLLAVLIAVAGGLSAVLTNDVVCLAMAPLLLESCRRRGLDPLPFLLALACAANVGSAATILGNPQNILIGQKLALDFGAYLFEAIVPSVLGLAATWVVIVILQRGRWEAQCSTADLEDVPYDAWQAGKALATLAVLVALFLFTSWPREVIALGGAGFLLASRRTRSKELLSLVDGQLLVLFVGLFIVNEALVRSGMAAHALADLRARGVDVASLPVLFPLCVVLSNLVSNVPAVMLLLPATAGPDPHAAVGASLVGPLLGVASTLAGNLLLVGSIANLIVADQAARLGLRIGYREHARVGVPVTIVTLAIAALWFWWRASGRPS